MKKILLLLFMIASTINLFAHSVQVAYCISCDGLLRLYVEHWHGNANPSSTTMTLEVTVDGVTTASTGSPVANLQDIPFAQLPNCASPPVVFASCSDRANTYNDWAVYDFPGIPTNSTASIRVISGNSAFTDDGCGMFPATTNNFVVAPINQPPITIPSEQVCSGTATDPIIFPPGNPSGGVYIWSNDNTSIGLGANGTGNIPSFTPPASTTTEVATITVDYLCASTTFTITVLPSAGPDFEYVNISSSSFNGADPNIQCLGDSTQFQAQTAPGVAIQSLLWDFGDGNNATEENPSHFFENTGTYNVTLQLVTTDGCTQSSSSFITINPKPVANFMTNNICDYEALQLNDNSTTSIGTIVAWNWIFGDGNISNVQNPTHDYATDGAYMIGLAVTTDAGCIDTTANPVLVYKSPTASFLANAACATKETFFASSSASTSPISSYDWDFEDDGIVDNSTSNPTHIYPGFGTYQVNFSVTDANGCEDDTIANVEVKALPTADFTFTTVCPNFPTLLTDASVVGGGANIASWNWDIGADGSVETNTQNGSKVWTSGGNYNVELRVVSDEGCEDSLIQTILVYPKPIASFTNTTVCYGNTTSFTDASSVGMNNSIIDWEWDFNDGNVSTAQNPDNDYNLFGTYDVTLMVETNNGCRDTVTNEVEVYSVPIVDFSMNNVCEYDSVVFINNTTIPDASLLTYQWNFDDNTMLSVNQPNHLYATEGIYNVNLQATSIHGCVHDSTIAVTIFDEPSAQFALANNCEYEIFTFTDYSSTTSSIAGWEWEYEDGGQSIIQSPQHEFNSEGIYDIQLVVTTVDGCTDTNNIDLEVYPKPVADFTPNDVCLNVLTDFEDISTVSTSIFPNENILPYSSWLFGDGNNGSGQTVTNSYDSPGSYTAEIIVTTNHNCKDTAEKVVLVHSNPIASFVTADSAGCSPWTADFINTSTIDNIPQNYSLAYQWYLDNDTETTDENISSVFTNEGHLNNEFYGASLVVTSNLGCKDSIYNAGGVIVHPIPFPDFNYAPDDATVYNTEINFEDLSIVGSEWKWSFGDGNLNNLQSPSYRYADSGTYDVKLVVENSFGCVDSINKIIRIDPVFEVFIPNSITPNGDGINDVFKVDGYGISEQQLFIYDKWGQLLFEGSNVGDEWDGFVKSDQNKISVYVYVVKIVDLYEETHDFKGSVTVIR